MGKKKVYFPEGFPGRLYNEWLRSGLTQMEVARRIGYERKSFRNWIYGDSVPSAQALAKLCRLFHVSADYLLLGKEEKDGGQKRDREAVEASATGNEGRE